MKQACYLLLFVFLIAASLSVYGRYDKVGGIRFGYQAATMFDNEGKLTGTEVLQSFYVGLFRDNKIVPLLRIGTGVEYFQNGFKTDDDNKLVLHYLSVPVHAKARIGPLFVLTGLSPSFKVSEKIFENGEKRDPSGDEKSEFFDIPIHVGAGVKFLFITLEARYHWGLFEVNNGYRNQYLQIGAGVSF
ncbi:MAG: outer membrane beta-barrel protein [Bacteroidales bacterium]|jgi:hypothetical protein